MAAVAFKQQAFARPSHLRLVEDAEPQDDASSYVADRRQVELFPETLQQTELFHDAPLVAVQPEFMLVASGETDDAAESAAKSEPLNARIFDPGKGAKISPPISAAGKGAKVSASRGSAIGNDPVSGANLQLVVTESIQSEYDGRKSAIKELAADAGCTPHTAKNWWKAKNLPDLVNAVNLAKEAPGIAITLVEQMVSHQNVFALLGELHRLAVAEAAQDPHFAIDYSAFVQKHLLGSGR